MHDVHGVIFFSLGENDPTVLKCLCGGWCSNVFLVEWGAAAGVVGIAR